MIISTLTTPLTKGQSTNSTASSFAAIVATLTTPVPSATRTIIDFPQHVPKDRNTLRVWPIGGNDDNDIINVKVTGWSFEQNTQNPAKILWVPGTICEVQATLSSTLVGLAGHSPSATEFFADTLTLTTGYAVLFQGTANVDTAWFECDISGFSRVEITGKLGAGTGDTMNWLYSFV